MEASECETLLRQDGENENMRKTSAMIVCLLFLASALGMSAVVSAGKPPTPQPPTGTIYFSYEDLGPNGYSLWKMNAADGSGKARVGAERCLYADGTGGNLGQLSWLTHGGHYWLIRFCQAEGAFPDGYDRHDLFAVRDDGAVTVQLTSGLNLEIGNPHQGANWGHDDQFVSWFASKWVQDAATGEWRETDPGLYRVGMSYGTDGNPEPIVETPALVLPTFLEYYGPEEYGGWQVYTYWYDWSPDGTQIVVAFNPSRPSCPGLCVVDIDTLEETYLTGGNFPSWSPNGAKIAYRCESDDMCIINPDGTGYKRILTIKDTESSWCGAVSLQWSPDSKHLAYQHYCYLHNQGVFRTWIYRVAIDGSQNTLLTRDLPTAPAKGPVGWR